MKKWKKALISGITLLMLSAPVSAQAAKIVIDPGHGGRDPGAIGVNGLYEKVVNRDVAEKLRDELIRRGYTAVLTSDTDRSMSLQERVDFKEAEQADLFISIHANSYPSPDVSGALVLYYDENYPQSRYPASPAMAALTPLNKKFAETVLNALVEETGLVNRGIVPSAVYVVRYGTMPSILVETAFLSNPTDAAKLADPNFRTRIALGIANGVWRFMPLGFSDTYGHWAQDAIHRLREHGIVEGHNNQFAPQRPVSRAEFLAMADRVFGFTAEQDEEAAEEPVMPEDSESHLDNEGNHDDKKEQQNEENNLDEQHELNQGLEPEEETDEAVHESQPGDETQYEDEQNEHEQVETISTKYLNELEIKDEPTHPLEFSDLNDEHWSFETIKKAVSLGYLQGYPDGTIRPDEPITRAEVSVLFDRIWNQFFEVTETPEFVDIPMESWYAKAVYKLRIAGLIMGVAPNVFAPERPMTRAEAAALFDRYWQMYLDNSQ